MRKSVFLALFTLIVSTSVFDACKKKEITEELKTEPITETPSVEENDPNLTAVPSTSQRSGNAATGYDFLVNGNYVSSGIPFEIYAQVYGSSTSNDLNRTGDAATVKHDFNFFTASNGVKLVAPNCLTCHAQHLNGKLIVGLGNSLSDYTADASGQFAGVDYLIKLNYGIPSKEYTAYEPFRRSGLALGSHIVADKKGVNVADKLTYVLAAYRDKTSLEWQTNPMLSISKGVIPTDVPAWWLLKKKNAMFYTGSGRGDFSRIMMASGLLTLSDSSEARTIDNKFSDVSAYLKSIEAPVFPQSINQSMADEGKKVFTANCQRCHGTYGANESYPNYLVSIDYIKTDSLLLSGDINHGLESWYNNSWFSSGSNSARIEYQKGYVAPPLDGVWATAPYLHNGSVPDLETVLNSLSRPKYWKRTFDANDYNLDTSVGWNYTTMSSGSGTDVYDTSLPGYGNQGHVFGDALSDVERTSLIEYLKTL